MTAIQKAREALVDVRSYISCQRPQAAFSRRAQSEELAMIDSALAALDAETPADRAAQAERMERLEEATIERCAITAETHWLTICGELSQHRERHEHGLGIAAAIRALSQEGSEPS